MEGQYPAGPVSRWDIQNPVARFAVDEKGNIIQNTGYDNSVAAKLYNLEINDPTIRVGDYYFVDGNPQVVPNSPTDLANRYQVIYGGTEKPEANIGWTNVGGSAVGGAATGALLGSTIGSVLPGPGTIIGGIAGALLGGLTGGLISYKNATDEAVENWNNEKVTYDTAVDFYRDEDGALKYKLNYQKIGMAGPRSDDWAKEMQTRETSVTLGDDGRLKVTVSPIFASTERFKEIIDWISENYSGLSRNTENYESIIKQIQDGIDGEVKSYMTNLQLYADYANRFSSASPDVIVPAYMTEIGGYVDPEKMGEYTMTLIDDENGVKTDTAKNFFDSVYDMNKDDRNRLLEKLTKIIYDEDNEYSDNEKAVALGEMRALYAVSNNSEGYKDDKYQGMLDADWFVTFLDHFAPLGLSAGDVIRFVSGGNWLPTKQEFLNQNDLAGFIGVVGGTAAGLGLFAGGTKLIEKGLKLLPGSSALFNASVEGYTGGQLAFIKTYLEGSNASNLVTMVKGLWSSGNIGAVGKAFAASAAFKTLKLGIFDAALAGTKTLVSGTDFWSEFGKDIARDAILETVFSYYDMVRYTKSVYSSTKQIYKNKETGEWVAVSKKDAGSAIIDDNGGILEPVGEYAIQQTRAGATVGVAKSEAGTVFYADGEAVFVSPTGETQSYTTSSDGVTDGIPLLNSGVAVESDVATTTLTDMSKTLERMGLSSDYELTTLPSQNVDAAVVAGKIAKFDSSRFGLAVNKWLFNRNASLETLNEMVLAKDADLTAWQNRTELMVSVKDNADQEIAKISNGIYVPSTARAFEDYEMALGEINLAKRFSKADGDYLKAIRAMEVATYFNKTKTIDDPRDYVAEALEKYGDAIAKMPQDRAESLNHFQSLRKARADAIKMAAKKSGKIDMKALDNVMESDMQTELGWVPQWRKKETYNGLLSKFYGISQQRDIYKTWFRNGGWVDLDKLEDPVIADDRFLGFVGFNMGVNDLKEITVDMLDKNGMLLDNTPSPATVRKQKLDSIKNKDELKDKMTEMVEAKKKEIKEKVPTQKQYADMMQKAIEDSGIMDAIADTISGDIKIDAVIGTAEVLMDEITKYNKFGYEFDVESYMNTSFLPDLKEAINAKNMGMASAVVNKAITDVAPYQSRAQLLKSAQESVAEEWRAWAEKHIKGGKRDLTELKKFVEDNDLDLPNDKRHYPEKVKHALWEKVEKGEKLPEIKGLNKDEISKDMGKEIFYILIDGTPLFQSTLKNKKELVDLVAAEINGETFDAYKMGAATEALGMGGRYPITFFRKGRPYTRFGIYHNKTEKRLLEDAYEILTDKQLVKQPGIVDRFASGIANTFRLLRTSLDPTRAPLNFLRDTGRGSTTAGGQSFIFANRNLKGVIELGDYTAAEKRVLQKSLDNVFDQVSGETYNAAYRGNRNSKTQATLKYLSKTGANPLKKFVYKATHDPLSVLEKPQDFFEGLTRRRLASSAATVKLGQLQREGASFREQVKGAVDAAFFAGREYTANFKRKGKLIEQTSKYVAYQSSAYAGLESMKIAFINNPKGVARSFGMFLTLYLILLADTLGNEKTRKNYYRLSDYDRGNSIVISIDEDTVMTLPLDQEIAAFLFPYRRIMETLNGTDPVSFYEFVWGTLTEPLPMDLSGFTEGEGFNLARGVEKLASQNMPNIISGVQEASTGYDLYYGSDLSVSDETLKGYGIYSPEPGDYTTSGKDSATLRRIANVTGIPQWQLQTMVDNYGGNVGAYILNIIDKLSGATEEQQGGKDFVDAIFKSFVATDQDAAASAFYTGIKQLQKDKHALVQKIANYNEDLKVASGDAKVALQTKLQKAKDDYAIKVGDFVDKYISAYEITGGLSKSQAMQVYYLFRLDDDDTVYKSGSIEEYYSNKALQRFKNEASAMSAPILDKYYNNRIGNVYQDSDGTWRRYLSSGAQAMRNSIYSESEEHMVSLLNILEGKGSNMKNLRTKVKNAREEAFAIKDYDTADKLGYEFDLKVIDAISPYIKEYGAENVLGTNEVLDYLSDWFFVPNSFKKTKRGGYVSLGNNASSQEAFVRPYIKYLFGLPTDYYSYSETSLTSPKLGDYGR